MQKHTFLLGLLLLLSACTSAQTQPTLVNMPTELAATSPVLPTPTTSPAANWLDATLEPTQPGLLLAIYTPESNLPSGYCLMIFSTENCQPLYQTDHQSDVGSFQVAPDGNWFVTSLWQEAANGYDLYALRTDGTAWQQLTDDSANEFIQDWSEMGDKLLYLRNDPNDTAQADKFRLYELALQNLSVTPLLPEADVHMACWLNQPNRIVFGGTYNGQTGIFTLDLATQTITQLAMTPKGIFSLARDKTRLLYETAKDEINLLNLQTGETQLVLPAGNFQRPGLWLANDSMVLLYGARVADGSVQPRLYVWNASSNTITEPAWATNKEFFGLAVSPDSKTVLLSLTDPTAEQAANFETYWFWDAQTDALTPLRGLPQGLLIARAHWGDFALPTADHAPPLLP